MFITKKHLSRQNGTERRRSKPGVAAAGRHGARRDGACSNRRGTQAPHGLFLHSPRRDHAQHRARAGDGQVDTQRCRRRFQTQPDSLPAGALQEVCDFFRQPGEHGQRGFGSHAQSCDVAQRHASEPGLVPDPRMAATLDQVIAKAIGQDTPLPSLEVASETTFRAPRAAAAPTRPCPSAMRNRRCRWNTTRERYSCNCSVMATRRRNARSSPVRPAASWISFRTAPKNSRPNSGIATVPFLTAIWRPFAKSSGGLRRPGHRIFPSLKIPNAPVGELENFAEQVKLMFDLLALAFQADLTRVASYIMVVGRDEPDLQPYRCSGCLPSGLPPCQRSGANQQAGEDPDLARAEIRRVCRQDGGNA